MSAISIHCLSPLARMHARTPVRVIRQPARYFRAMPVVRAQAEKHEKAQEASKPAEEKGIATRQQDDVFLAPLGAFGFPSFGRMGQVMKEMEDEMHQFSRVFGLPSLRAFEPFDLPSISTDVPVSARALACDVRDLEDHIEVQADVPGLTKEDIKVSVSPDKVLQISGERKQEKKEGKKGEGAWTVERSYGSFVRRFRLPENVDLEGIKAQVKDGVLKLTVPKTEEAKPKHIEVQLE